MMMIMMMIMYMTYSTVRKLQAIKKARTVSCHEDTEAEYGYRYTLSLTSALDGVDS
jgi:hypothetical protein